MERNDMLSNAADVWIVSAQKVAKTDIFADGAKCIEKVCLVGIANGLH